MEKISHKKNLIFFSETIFSDRICKNILQNSNDLNIHVVYSDHVAKLDNDLKNNDRDFLYRLRVLIVRNLVEILRYVSPSKTNDIALKDHFHILAFNWKWHLKFFYKLAINILRKSYLLRKLIQKIVIILIPKDVSADILSKFNDFNVLVFSVGNLKSLSVISFIATSKKYKNTKSYTFIQSWDNPTTKGYGSFTTDFYFTWTELMRDEINLYQDIPLRISTAVGSPSLLSEKTIHRSQISSSNKQKIIFATKSPASYKSNLDIAKKLAKYAIKNNFNFEVRVHPLCLHRKSEELKEMIDLSKEYGFYIRYPESDSSKVILDSNKDNLALTSQPDDILVTVYSTMNIEAAYLGLKCINIDFATCESKTFSPRVNIELDRRQPHNKRILSYGYIYNATSMTNLLETIEKLTTKNYNNYKQLNKRKELINKECMPVYDVNSLLKLIT